MASKLLKMLPLIIICGHLVKAQSNGDLRLVQGSSRDEYDMMGRLEIYLDGEWGTFCVKNFNSNAGDTACRQLGYAESFGEILTANLMILIKSL